MDFSGMLMDNLKKQAMNKIVSKLGGNSDAANSVVSQALPMLLGQLEKNAQDPVQAENINTALNSHLGETKIDEEDGKNILSHIFGNTQNPVQELTQKAEINEEQASSVLGTLSSLVMETLGDQKKAASGFAASDITKLLSGTGVGANVMGMMMDQDGDGDFDTKDAMSFGMGMLKKKIFGGK